MITKLTTDSFRSLEGSFDLKPFTVIVGDNGVGKSSILYAIELLGAMMNAEQQGFDRLRVGQVGVQSFAELGRIQHRISTRPLFSCRYELTGHVGGESSIMNASATYESPFYKLALGIDSGNDALKRVADYSFHPESGVFPSGYNLTELKRLFDKNASLRETVLFAAPERTALTHLDQKNKTHLTNSGMYLPSAIKHFHFNDFAGYQLAEECLSLVIEDFSGLRVSESKEGHEQLSVLMRNGDTIPLWCLSEGTLRAIGIVFIAFCQRKHPSVILIDDIESGLHPRAQIEMIKSVRLIQQHLNAIAEVSCQIIVTTHSPFILDGVKSDEVLVLAKDPKSGLTKGKLLSEHPRYGVLGDKESAGDLWAIVEEDWVISDAEPTLGQSVATENASR